MQKQASADWTFQLVAVLFGGSGCAALIYEVVWFQSLELVIGSTAISLGLLLAVFMGGMSLGSVALPRFIPDSCHPLRAYALIESCIGLSAVVLLWAIPFAGRIYISAAGSPSIDSAVRALFCTVCLLVPTFLMGAAFPIVARWFQLTATGVSRIGFLYTANIVGAFVGSLAAGFYLLRYYNATVSTFVAVVINFIAAFTAFQLSRSVPSHVAENEVERPRSSLPATGNSVAIYIAIGLSGFCALGAEVLWTRLLGLMLGSTTYTLSLVLAVFLLGLGIGTAAGSSKWTENRSARYLGYCQMLLAVAVAWSAYMLTSSLPYWPIYPILSEDPWINAQLDIFRSILVILPATFLWGMSFPLALRSVAAKGNDSGKVVGILYAANTVGAIAGALLFSIVLIPAVGTQRAEQLLIAVSAISGLLVLVRANFGEFRMDSVVPLTLLAIVLFTNVPSVPPELIAYGRLLPFRLSLVDQRTGAPFTPHILAMKEGLNASIAVSQTPDGVRSFHVSGKTEASSSPGDMQLQRMLADLPALAHPRPRSILVVGFGAGITSGAFTLIPGVERIVICEIEPSIPQIIPQYFAKENYGLLNDRRVHVVSDDARHFLLTTTETFDIITSDPIHPWVKGSAALYTREYFDLVRKHLNPGGRVTQWVPLYETGLATVKIEMATFFDVFADASIWGNRVNGQGYDMVMMGGDGSAVDVDAIGKKLEQSDYGPVAASLREVGFDSASQLFGTFAGDSRRLGSWLRDTELNTDANLRLQYVAAGESNINSASLIYQQIISHFVPALQN